MTEKRIRGLLILLPVLVCLLGVLSVSAAWRQDYRQSDFVHLANFCEILLEDSPELKPQVLSALKKYDAAPHTELPEASLLTDYGYQSSAFGQEPGRRFFFLSALLFLTASGSFLAASACADRRDRKRISELTAYLEQVNAGTGRTLIQQKEDRFSHLQDELYKTVTELRQTREAAVHARICFADNLANIAHQLKTPITAALLSLQLMEKPAADPHAEQIQQQLRRLGTLEEALLTLSRIDAGTLQLEHAPVDLYTALNLAAENLEDLLRKEQVSVSIPDKGGVWITGDLGWTMEALINLMKNCMEHSPRDGVIHCDYAQNPLYAEIRIWDEGRGFCPEDLPHLFERFYRGKQAAGDGIGIGLPLARSVFEMQNGTVSARNLPEGGACFEVRVYSH